MSKALTTVQTTQNALTFSRDQVDLIKRTIAKGATDDELKLFLYQCEKRGLDPLSRQIYFQKRKTKSGDQMTILTAIDGYRLIADRTGKYAGNDEPVFDEEASPSKATSTVYKIVGGVRCPFTATARWHQYYPGDAQGFMWNKMPHLMLGKCAEALALRKAFPEELGGLYVEEEMHQAGKPIDYDASKTIEAETKAPAQEATIAVYNATDSQKVEFSRLAKQHGISLVPELIAASKACIGLDMGKLDTGIKEWKEMQNAFSPNQ